MKQILLTMVLSLLFFLNVQAQWNSEFNNAWWSNAEDGIDKWFPTGFDSTSTTLVIGGAGDTVNVPGDFDLDGDLIISTGVVSQVELEILDGATVTTTQVNYLGSATGTTGTASTNIVFSTSPTLITPALGTPSAIVLTNASGSPTLTAVTVDTEVYGAGWNADLSVPTKDAAYDQIETLPTVAEVNTQINTIMDDSLLTGTTQGSIAMWHNGGWWENVNYEDSAKTDFEAVLVLSNLQGAVTDGQVPNNITILVTTHSLTTDSTLAAALCYGGVFYVPEAQTITLPAVAIGMSMTFITIGAVAVSIDPNASDLMYLDGIALADGDKATNTSTAGDIIVFTYYDATGWYASSNSWTDGN